VSKKQQKQQVVAKKEAASIKKTPAKPVRNYYVIILIAVTSLVYISSLSNGWTDWDDEGYVLQDSMVKTFDVPQIFSSYVVGNYHPVTMLVMSAEYQVFDESASGYHTMSLLLQLINCLLVFWFIDLLARKKMTAFIVALLFGIHPLHVESVSWISEQKDLLYVLFYLLALIFYLRYDDEKKKDLKKYFVVLLFFVLSLLSKAQAVTLPVILILIDWFRTKKISFMQQLDKIPLFTIAFIAGIVAIFAQKQSSAIQDITAYSWAERFMFASFGIVSYLWRLFVPIKLSAYYSYPMKMNGSYPAIIYAAPFIVLAIAAFIFFYRKKYLVLVFGSLFFFINILLVLQLLPIGGAITADRYSYLSFIGLFFIIATTVTNWWGKRNATNSTPKVLLLISGAWLAFLLITAYNRTSVWKNSETLFTDVISKYDNVAVAYNNLGWYYLQQKKLDLAKTNFTAAMNLQPDFVNAVVNRYDVFKQENNVDSALIDARKLLKLRPDLADPLIDCGTALVLAGKNDSAEMYFRKALEINDTSSAACQNFANLFSMEGKMDSAIKYYSLALKYKPSIKGVTAHLGVAYLRVGEYTKAVTYLTAGLAEDPEEAEIYVLRMQAHEKAGDYQAALQDANRALQGGASVSQDDINRLKAEAGAK
jgi:protein O-mannosyl-transferase